MTIINYIGIAIVSIILITPFVLIGLSFGLYEALGMLFFVSIFTGLIVLGCYLATKDFDDNN